MEPRAGSAWIMTILNATSTRLLPRSHLDRPHRVAAAMLATLSSAGVGGIGLRAGSHHRAGSET